MSCLSLLARQVSKDPTAWYKRTKPLTQCHLALWAWCPNCPSSLCVQQGHGAGHPQYTAKPLAIRDVHHEKTLEYQTKSSVFHLYRNRGTPQLAQTKAWRSVAPSYMRERPWSGLIVAGKTAIMLRAIANDSSNTSFHNVYPTHSFHPPGILFFPPTVVL